MKTVTLPEREGSGCGAAEARRARMLEDRSVLREGIVRRFAGTRRSRKSLVK